MKIEQQTLRISVALTPSEASSWLATLGQRSIGKDSRLAVEQHYAGKWHGTRVRIEWTRNSPRFDIVGNPSNVPMAYEQVRRDIEEAVKRQPQSLDDHAE